MLRSSDGFYDSFWGLSISSRTCWPSSRLSFLCKDSPSAIEHAHRFLSASNIAADGTQPCSSLRLQHRCLLLSSVFLGFLGLFGACSKIGKRIRLSHRWLVRCWLSCWYSGCFMDPSLRFFSKEPLKPSILLVCRNILQSFLGSKGYRHLLFCWLFKIFPMPCCTTFCQSRPMQAISISRYCPHDLICPQRTLYQHHNFLLWDLGYPKTWDILCVLHCWCRLFPCKETQEIAHNFKLPLCTILSSRTCLLLLRRLHESFEDSVLLCSWSELRCKILFWPNSLQFLCRIRNFLGSQVLFDRHTLHFRSHFLSIHVSFQVWPKPSCSVARFQALFSRLW